MKKTLFSLVLAFVTITSYSQNYFEKFIEPEDGVFREAEYVIETEDHGFIISCCTRYIDQNGMLIKITADGEITNRLIFQIDEKNLRYCGLYKSPDHENEYIAIAVLAGIVNSSYVQTELAFLRFDSDLNIISQNVCSLDEGYAFFTDNSQKDYPRFVLREDGTFLMAAHCFKTDGYCYIFATMTPDGEIIKIREDGRFNESVNFLYDLFARDKGGCGMISVSNIDNGGEFYYIVDSALNCVKISRLTGLALKVVQTNPQYPDTTYSYVSDRGTAVAYNDTSFLMTNHTKYLKHLGGGHGFAYFVAKMNDSLDVHDIRIWDVVSTYEPVRRVAGVKALSVTDDAVYHCGFNGHYHYEQIYYTQLVSPTIITVSKFDKEMNLLWRRYYGANDNSYQINVIQATEDGGCILTGVSALKSNYSYYMSYVLKLDADGYDSVDEAESIARPYLCYPNPTKGNLYIELSPDVKCQSVEIYDIDGRLVETFPETSQQTTIDISGLNTGMYIVKLRTADGKEYEERIIKK